MHCKSQVVENIFTNKESLQERFAWNSDESSYVSSNEVLFQFGCDIIFSYGRHFSIQALMYGAEPSSYVVKGCLNQWTHSCINMRARLTDATVGCMPSHGVVVCFSLSYTIKTASSEQWFRGMPIRLLIANKIYKFLVFQNYVFHEMYSI